MVLDRDLPIPPTRRHGRAERVVPRLPPVAGEKLAGPDRHENIGVESLGPLQHIGAAAFLAAAPGGHELSAQRGLALFADNFIAGVDRRIDRGVGASAPFRLFASRQDVHQVQFAPLGLAGPEFVADVINQEREEGDIGGERHPGEHLFVDPLEPVLVERTNHQEINNQQQEQPLHRQLAHLPAVDHRAENPVNTLAAIRDQLGRAKPTRRNAAQLGPEPIPVFPGTEWLALRTKQQNG